MRHRLPAFEMQDEIFDPRSPQVVPIPDMFFDAQRLAFYAFTRFFQAPKITSPCRRLQCTNRSGRLRNAYYQSINQLIKNAPKRRRHDR